MVSDINVNNYNFNANAAKLTKNISKLQDFLGSPQNNSQNSNNTKNLSGYGVDVFLSDAGSNANKNMKNENDNAILSQSKIEGGVEINYDEKSSIGNARIYSIDILV